MANKVDPSRGSQLLNELLKTTKQTQLEAKTTVKQATISQLKSLRSRPSRRVAVLLEAVGIPSSAWDEAPAAEQGAA